MAEDEHQQMDPLAKVQEILSKASEEIKSVQVDKEEQYDCDLGHLLVTDNNVIDYDVLRNESKRGAYLQDLARDSIQVLFSKVWNLPTHVDANTVFVTLPKPTTILPREKPVPKPKPLTKWEQFAKERGIRNVKKEKNVWDETLRRWVPRYGLRKVQAEKEKNWVKEVPKNTDPFEDQFAKSSKLKKERIARNEYQRLRNIAKARKLKVPNVGVTGNEFASSKDLGMAIHHSKFATASKGKFQPSLPNEKTPKNLGKRKRVEYATGDVKREKKVYFDVLDKMNKGQLNLDSAVKKQVKQQNVEDDLSKFGGKKKLRRSKAGGRNRATSDYRAAKLGRGIHQSRQQAKAQRKAKSTSGLGLGKARPVVQVGNKGAKGARGKGGGGGGKRTK